MAEEFKDINGAFSALKAGLEAVSTNKLTGANDLWIADLLKKFTADGDEKRTITSLQFFDAILRSSIPTIFPVALTDAKKLDEANKALGRLVNETRGYLDLTERFFSELRKLTAKDQKLEDAAVTARNKLLEVLNRVQKWLLEEAKGISPSEFGACTNQFLSRMKEYPKELSLTQQLFKNQLLELEESDLKTLTDAWGNVVSTFVEDAQDTDKDDPLNVGDPKTIASFLCIHERLETLYGRLGTNVSLVN